MNSYGELVMMNISREQLVVDIVHRGCHYFGADFNPHYNRLGVSGASINTFVRSLVFNHPGKDKLQFTDQELASANPYPDVNDCTLNLAAVNFFKEYGQFPANIIAMLRNLNSTNYTDLDLCKLIDTLCASAFSIFDETSRNADMAVSMKLMTKLIDIGIRDSVLSIMDEVKHNGLQKPSNEDFEVFHQHQPGCVPYWFVNSKERGSTSP